MEHDAHASGEAQEDDLPSRHLMSYICLVALVQLLQFDEGTALLSVNCELRWLSNTFIVLPQILPNHKRHCVEVNPRSINPDAASRRPS